MSLLPNHHVLPLSPCHHSTSRPTSTSLMRYCALHAAHDQPSSESPSSAITPLTVAKQPHQTTQCCSREALADLNRPTPWPKDTRQSVSAASVYQMCTITPISIPTITEPTVPVPKPYQSITRDHNRNSCPIAVAVTLLHQPVPGRPLLPHHSATPAPNIRPAPRYPGDVDAFLSAGPLSEFHHACHDGPIAGSKARKVQEESDLHAADFLVGAVLARKDKEGGLDDAATQAEHQVKGGLCGNRAHGKQSATRMPAGIEHLWRACGLCAVTERTCMQATPSRWDAGWRVQRS